MGPRVGLKVGGTELIVGLADGIFEGTELGDGLGIMDGLTLGF